MPLTKNLNSDNYCLHWDEKFSKQTWGKYPPEDLVRFVGKNYKNIIDKSSIRVLDIGCGPGANIWFLHREGFNTCGIDSSKTAIAIANKRIQKENSLFEYKNPDLKVGNFKQLPWEENFFDLTVDIFAIYANKVEIIDQTLSEIIDQTLSEIKRVLKPNGKFYSKLWGKKTTGFAKGKEIEKDTFDEISEGPCKNMGISHFFDSDSINSIFGKYFLIENIECVLREDTKSGVTIEEYHCQFIKE